MIAIHYLLLERNKDRKSITTKKSNKKSETEEKIQSNLFDQFMLGVSMKSSNSDHNENTALHKLMDNYLENKFHSK